MIKPKTPVQKVLVITLSNLGDVILTLPVLEKIKERYPQARLDVLVGKGGYDLLKSSGYFSNVLLYDKKISWGEKAAWLSRIRKEKYDWIIDLRHSLFGLLGGANYRNPYFLKSKHRHKAVQHLNHLPSFLREDTAPQKSKCLVQLAVKGEAIFERYAELRQEIQKIIIAPGSKSDTKRWPEERFAALIQRILAERGVQIVLIGDPSEKKVCDSICKRLGYDPRILNLAGQTTIAELAAVTRTAKLVITNDSAPLHLADALEVPVLAIFGPTEERKYGPRRKKGIVVRRTLFCTPCEKAQCRYQHECMTELSVDDLYKRTRELLEDFHVKKNFKVLITRLDRIGDVLLSLPAVAAIRERFPNAHLAFMCRPELREILDSNPLIDEVIVYDYSKKGRHSGIIGNLRFIREIIRKKFDTVFILHPSHRSHLVPFAAGIPYRIGFEAGLDSVFLTKRVPNLCHEGKKHESEYILDIVRSFGIEPKERHLPKIYLYADEIKKAELLVANLPGAGPLVGIHPGASCPSKRWSANNFTQLAHELLKFDPALKIIVVGGRDVESMGKDIAETNPSRILNLAGKLSLRESAAVLKLCRLVISNDSGPAHMAAAVDTPVISLFGRNQAALGADRWKPLGLKNVVLQKNVGCAVCLAHACTIQFECLEAIRVEEVLSHAARYLWPKATLSEESSKVVRA